MAAQSPIIVAVLVSIAVLQLVGASQCTVGNAECFCNLIRGTWTATPTTIRPTCRKTVESQGSQRIVDVYFPTDIGAPDVKFTPWVHLHGVMLSTWWLESNTEWQQLSKKWPTPMGGNADASRMNALTGSPITAEGFKVDGSGLVKRPGYILLVPQGSGDVTEGQMWNSLFWRCMTARRCISPSIDDVTLMDYIITNMQTQLLPGLPLQPRTALSGYSNGGMMVQTLLCRKPEVAAKLSGVALIGTMMGSDFAAASCQQKLPRSLPLVWLHGEQDNVLLYQAGTSMGVKSLGAEGGTKLWADRMGCPGVAASSKPPTIFSDPGAGVTCVNLCGGQTTTAVLCAAAGAGHGMWDQPGPGYSAGIAHWAFNGFAGKPQPL